jgi:hypothetical protein
MAITEDFSTAILRFRDLVTPQGETIRLHSDIINANPDRFVWWGWWSKAGEQIPDDAFRQLLDLSHQGAGLDVYLMDSGMERLYRARLVDVHWDIGHARVKSPDEDFTPTYYREQAYFAWLKFTGIEPADPEVLHTLTYARVDPFFTTRESRYNAFYGKRVHSVHELRQQDRTIWFVRPVGPEDRTHEVSLLDPRRITPAHFPTNFVQTASRTILWLSDLHFAVDGYNGFPLHADAARESLARAVEAACTHRGIETVAGVIVSGDLTWRADPAESTMAGTFLRELNTWAKLDSYGYALCPGNHDVRFSPDPAAKDQLVTIAAPEERAAYARLYEDMFYTQPNAYLSSGRRFLLGGTVPVEIVLLNSSLLQQAQGHFQGHGFVGEEQLEHAAGSFGWDASTSERAARVLVLHHHLLPVTYREEPRRGLMFSVALDAEAIMRWAVRCHVDLVIHGHMHHPSYARVTRPVTAADSSREHTFTVVAGGSVGVALGHVGEELKNTFGVLTFSSNDVIIDMHSIHPVNPPALLWSVAVPLKRN